MLKKEYLNYFYTHKLYQTRIGLSRVSYVLPEREKPIKDFPVWIKSESKIGFIDRETNEVEYIEDAFRDAPLFGLNEPLKLEVDDYSFIKEDTETTYRTFVMNALIIFDVVGTELGYFKEIDKKVLSGILEEGFKNNTLDVTHLNKMSQRTFFAGFLNTSCTPTGSTALYRSNKEAIKVRDELVAKYKDQLHNPAIVGMINKAVIEVLAKKVNDDESKGFYINPKKTLNKAYFNTHGMIGGVPSLTDPGEVITITKSLTEGWNHEDLVAMNNNSRGGSYDRGKDTALGGESFKTVNKIIQNVEITMDDCLTTVGINTRIDKNTYKEYVGRYVVGGKTPLTEEELKSKIGKELVLRSPGTCKTPDGNLCKKCLGDQVSSVVKKALAPIAAEATGSFLSIFLAAFHGKTIQTVPWDKDETLF